MPVANPYFIKIELVWANGTPANQNQIARVRAFDVHNGVTTEQGQSGYNPATGGWFPVYMQNIAAFYPPRQNPSLYFRVESTQEVVLKTTQTFANIPSGTTVRIVIDGDATIVGGGGGGPTQYSVSGTITVEGGGAFAGGIVTAYDFTNGSMHGLGSTTTASDGTYLITFYATAFQNNGSAHSSPNLMIRVFNGDLVPLKDSGVTTNAPNPATINLAVPAEATEPPGEQRRVYGDVKNTLGLPVSGLTVRAFHLAWTSDGLQEFQLGVTTTTGNSGEYEILYYPPAIAAPPHACFSDGEGINLIVYVSKLDEEEDELVTLATSEMIFDAPPVQRVDLSVDEISTTTGSEYRRIDDAIGQCLGTDEAKKLETINQLNTRRDYLTFISKATGQPEALLLAYVRAWLIAGEINDKVPGSALSAPMTAEPMYALVRAGQGESLAELLDLLPNQFFATLLDALARGVISSELEAALPTLLEDWRIILSKMLINAEEGSWQNDLISLVVEGGEASFPTVQSVTPHANSANATSYPIPLPTTAEGDLLLLILVSDYHAAITAPAGWTKLWDDTTTNEIRLGGYAKVATGADGSTATFTVTGTEPGAAQVHRVLKANWYGSLDGVSVGTTKKSSSNTLTFNALNPPWDTTKTLWIAVGAHEESFNLSTIPTGFSNQERTTSGTATGNVTVLTARKQDAVASMNPSSFVIATADNWITCVVAIRPRDPVHADREAVVAAHFDAGGDFERMLTLLAANPALADLVEDLRFVLELYQAVDKYLPMVETLYVDKATRQWDTIADLASVPLRSGGPGGSGWDFYASAQQGNTGQVFPDTFPGDIPGRTSAEKIEVYAQRLYAKFGNASQQNRFASEAEDSVTGTPPEGFEDAVEFLKNAEGFDLGSTPIDKYLADEEITLSEEAIEQLKQLQRVYRLTPDFEIAAKLIEEGLDSAVKIARHDEDQFVADYEEVLGGLTVARGIHRKAKHYASEIFAALVRFNQTVNDVGGSPMMPAGVNLLAATAAATGAGLKYPNWVALFGNLNSAGSRHCQTVLGAGAYLVDLLTFVEGAPKNYLLARRPDLAEIELTCANTDRVVPYIDLVNEILGAVVEPHDVPLTGIGETALLAMVTGDASPLFDRLRAAGYVLTERAVLKLSPLDTSSAHVLVVEDDSWRFTIRLPGSGSVYHAYGAPQTSETGQLLDVFPEHYNPRAVQKLEQAVFPFQLPLAMGREETELVLTKRRTAHHELLEAFHAGLATDVLLDDEALARAYLRLTEDEEAAILSAATVERPIWKYWGFDIELDTDVVTVPRPEDPSEPFSGTWREVMAQMSVFLHRSQLTYKDVLELVDTRFIQDSGSGVGLVTVTAGPAEEAQENVLEANYNRFWLTNTDDPSPRLTEETLRRMSFFLRLRRKLGWSIVTTDRVLYNVFGGAIPGNLTGMSQFVRLSKDLGIEPARLTGLWSYLDRRRTARNPRSLFDEVYLKGDPVAPEYQALDRVARNAGTIAVHIEPATPAVEPPVLQLDAFKTYLRGALRLSAEDMDTLWNAVIGVPDPESSTPQNVALADLSAMHAVALFSRAVRVSVADYYRAKALFAIDPLPVLGTGAFLSTYSAVKELERWRRSGISLPELSYLLRHESPEGSDLGLDEDDFEETYRQLAARGSDIVARYPSQAPTDPQIVQALLEEVMPADKTGSALSLLESPTPPADATFLTRYFTAFWPGLGSDLALLWPPYAPLPALPPPAEVRYTALWTQLRPFLVARARRAAALEIAAARTGAPADVVDKLLTTALTIVAVGTNPALDDWTFGLGGWSDGSETLFGAAPGERETRWIVPEDGEYRFVIRGQGGALTDVDFRATGSLRVQGSGAEIVSPPMTSPPTTRKAGDVVRLSVAHDAGNLTLLVRRDNDDPELLAASVVTPFNGRALTKLDKAVRLVGGLKLTTTELDYTLFNDASLFDDLPLGTAEPVDWERLAGLVDQLALNRRVRLDKTTLFELLREPIPESEEDPDPDPVEDAERIAKLTGWKEEDIEAIRLLFVPDPPPDPELPPFRDIDTWFVLDRCMALVGKIDLRAKQIIDLLVTNQPSVAAAIALRNSLRSSFSDDTWRDTFKPVRDQLRQRERDALVGYLTTRPIEINGEDHYFIDPNDLFAHYLIDVQMEPDTSLSRIKLALNSIQLFVQRVFLGLDPDKALRQLEKKQAQWKWMGNYRVWEANRKIFLFPENWIEPELRDDKTELFRDIERELMQDAVTSERAERLLTSFVERLDEISDLIVVGACTEGVYYAGTSNVLHIVARTRSAPYTYYHRTFRGRQFDDGVFSPWRKVAVEIDARSVAPVVVGGALRLFWPMVKLKEKVAKDEGNPGNLQSKAEIRLMWTTLVPALGEWSKPRLGSDKVFDYYPVNVFDRGDKDDGPDVSCYHFRTGVEQNAGVKVEVYKSLTFLDVHKLSSGLKLGEFIVNAAGEDFGAQAALQIDPASNNHPNGAYLLHNAAYEANSEFLVDFRFADGTFTMRGSLPFFAVHTPPFRVLVSNFGYLGEARNEPFFFETPTNSLFALHRGTSGTPGLSHDLTQVAAFITFNHPQLHEVKNRLTANGPPGIMNRLTQALPMSDGRYYYSYSNNYISATGGAYHSGYNNRYNGYYGGVYLGYHIAGDTMAWGITQRDFETEFQPGTASVERPFPLPTVEFGYGTAFGAYNWELFFHLPMLVADRLSTEMRFEEAMSWYHHIFDPRLDLNAYEKGRRFPYRLPRGARYWNFLPFFANKDATDSLLDVFGVKQALTEYERADLKAIINEWRLNPFNPHLIARHRIAAYQKSVVMKYLENLLAWGDQLFRQDTFESINQATQLYVLAAEILGKRPEVIEPLEKEKRLTYRELVAEGIDLFSNALIDMENLMVATSSNVEGKDVDAASGDSDSPQGTALATLYFRIPRNEKLDRYWDTVADRLFKIRNSMNIDGVKRTLALFEPPIDPALLVRALAMGIDLSAALSQLNQPLPSYRFSVWSAKAQDLANELKSFGGSLLATLEKKDGEELALLRQTHELRLLGLVKKVREEQIAEAEANIEALEASQALAQDRLDDYSGREFVNSNESTAATLTDVAGGLDTAAGVFNTVAGILALIPETAGGAFSATIQFGGNNLKGSMNAFASALGTGSTVARLFATKASTMAGYERRQEDWDLQIRQAQLEIQQLDKQKIASQIRLAIAEKELLNHEAQIEQSQEVNDFFQSKFTNQELYQWMSSELMRTYRLAYNLALDVAKTAERTFQFELGINDVTYIEHGYFESQRQGLLAGEKLSYDVKRMDIAYLQKDRREFELTKAVSLAALAPGALQELRNMGKCMFVLPEVIFDLDHPGHYFRRIQAVRLTIPCVTGPYTSVGAKLSLLGSSIRVQGTSGDSGYPYQEEDPRFVHDVGGIQSIATSTSQDDAGLFELNFRDERYLPFEGAGAISRWSLELPEEARQFDYHTISDVVVTISYTARDGGGSLKAGATAALTQMLNGILDALGASEAGLQRVFSMKREFPDALHQLLTSGTTTMAILPQHFPFLFRDKGYTLSPFDANALTMTVVPKTGKTVPESRLTFAFMGGAPEPEEIVIDGDSPGVPRSDSTALVAGWNPETWTFTQVGSGSPLPPESLTLKPEDVDDIVFELQYLVA